MLTMKFIPEARMEGRTTNWANTSRPATIKLLGTPSGSCCCGTTASLGLSFLATGLLLGLEIWVDVKMGRNWDCWGD